MALPPKRSIPQSPRTATRVEDFAQRQSWYVTCLSVWSDDSSSFSWLFVTLLLFLAKGIITTLECEGDWLSAVIVLFAALIPCCMWAVFFVYMSKRGHNDQFHEHLSFGVLAQTFWCGAIVAPIAVYTVRAFAAGIVTALLGYSAMAFSAEPPTNEEGQGGVSVETIMATAWLAFILAGFSEETAKYFVASRWVRAKDDSLGSKAELEEDMGGCSYAIGWSKRTRSPRKVVLLAMVVGLGFAWIENVQYGVRTYEQMQNTQVLMDVTKADITVVCTDPLHPRIVVLSGSLDTPIAEAVIPNEAAAATAAAAQEVTQETQSIPALITSTKSKSKAAAAEKAKAVEEVNDDAQRAYAQEQQHIIQQQKQQSHKMSYFMSTDSGWIPFLGKMTGISRKSSGGKGQLHPVYDDREIIWEFKNQILQGIYESFAQTKLSLEKATDGMHSYITKGILRPSNAKEYLRLSSVSAAEDGRLTVGKMGEQESDGEGGENSNSGGGISYPNNNIINNNSNNEGEQQQQQKSSGRLGVVTDDPKQRESVIVRALTRYGFADPNGNQTEVAITSWNQTAINCTVQTMDGRPLYDEERGATATMITVTRGFMPMHAIWAGLSGMRYVRAHWIIQASNGFFIDPIKCISRSWLYHGAFDFFLMSADQLRIAMQPEVTNPYVSWFIVMAAGTFIILSSWVHLVKEGDQLERDLNRNGYPGSQDIANVALCSSRRRRAYCCICESCCCPSEGDDSDDDDHTGNYDDDRHAPLLDAPKGESPPSKYGSA